MSLDNLPVEWKKIEISEICDPKQYKTIPISELTEDGFVVYGANGVIGKYSKFTHEKSTLMITCRGATCGNLHISQPYSYINGNAMALDNVSGHINLHYLYYCLKARGLEDVISGSAQPQITRQNLVNAEIIITSLKEQQEIVRQLDIMLAQVEQIKARLDAIPAILKKFRQSVLADAVSGKLTEEWRSVNPILESASQTKEKWLAQRREKFNEQYPKKKFKEPSLVDDKYMPWDEIPNDWDLVSVSEFAECLDNLRVPIKKDDRNSNEGLYPYFGANGEVDRVDEFIIDDDIVLVTEDETFYGRTKPIAYRYYGKCWVNNHVHVLKAPTREANDYLCYALMYYHVIPWLTGTTGRAKLSQAALNSLPLLMPPVKEIEVIVANVNKLLEHAEKIENVIQSAQKRVNLLTQSILAKAFSGELTAEWREQHQDLITGVNSAEALLAKNQKEREASKPVKKTRVKKEA